MSGDTVPALLEDMDAFEALSEREQDVIVTYVTGGMTSMVAAYCEHYKGDPTYRGTTANASKWFRRPRIQAAIKQYRTALAQERIAEGAEVMAALSDIVTGSVVDAIDDDGQVKLDKLRRGSLRHLVKSIRHNRKDDSVEITAHSKTEAAKILIQTLGIDQGRLQNRIDVNVLNVQVPGIGAGGGDAAQVVEQLNELPEGGE
ncbi:MAG: terminase small subunit [Epibacterium sp.]|nr:terminase small subunit [Epibacterium sp.]NQX73780.1 terminase small subunit [Epibacterium sp.]